MIRTLIARSESCAAFLDLCAAVAFAYKEWRALRRLRESRPFFMAGIMLDGDPRNLIAHDIAQDEYVQREREHAYTAVLRRLEYRKTLEASLRRRNHEGIHCASLKALDREIRQLIADERIEREMALAYGVPVDGTFRQRYCPSMAPFLP